MNLKTLSHLGPESFIIGAEYDRQWCGARIMHSRADNSRSGHRVCGRKGTLPNTVVCGDVPC